MLGGCNLRCNTAREVNMHDAVALAVGGALGGARGGAAGSD